MAEECLCMNLGKSTGDCLPVQLDEDIWTQVVTHGPGNEVGPVSVANRSILYRLKPEGGDPFLVVLNALWCDDDTKEPCASVRKLADELGAPVKFVLTPGSGHHLSLHRYAEAFPDARICIPAGRIERHNTELFKFSNAETYTGDTVPAELAAGGLDVILWEGLVEGPTAKKFARLQMNFSYALGDVQPQCFLHRPSGTITNGGHHMWFCGGSEEEVFKMPGPMKFIMKLVTGARFDYVVPGKIMLDPNLSYSVADRAKVQASAKRVLAWEFDKMIDIHAGLNSQLASGARAVFEEALGPVARGEWDQVAWHQPAG
jgi:hypothetical protein